MKQFAIILTLLGALTIAACGSEQDFIDEPTPSPTASPSPSPSPTFTPIPNPEFHIHPDGADVIPDRDTAPQD